MSCIVHYNSLKISATEDVKELTALRMKSLKTASKNWKVILHLSTSVEEQSIIKNIEKYMANIEGNPLATPLPTYHNQCYKRFIDKKRLQQLRKRKASDFALHSNSMQSSHYSPKKLRSSDDLSKYGSENTAVLPPVCIICKKQNKFITKNHKRVKDALCGSETHDGGTCAICMLNLFRATRIRILGKSGKNFFVIVRDHKNHKIFRVLLHHQTYFYVGLGCPEVCFR